MGVIRDWIIEFDGKPVGRLVNGRFTDMVWETYDVDPIPQFADTVFDPANWLSFHFRDPESGGTVSNAAPSMDYAATLQKSQIRIRGLYTQSDLDSTNNSTAQSWIANVSAATYALFFFAFAIAVVFGLNLLLTNFLGRT